MLYLSQSEPKAWLWRPGEAGGHEPIATEGLAAGIDVPALGVRLVMAEAYADVRLATAAT